MKIFKKILYLFLILFTLSFSMDGDGDKSKVILNKRRDAAELKIGVTKIISKELPLEFHAESKKIYGEIDIDDNDLIFVSETLDEIPSVSTTNGRKSINNIKRYLTKEIKKSPKFEYRIVEEKPEADKTEGKKYLLIDCKEQLSSVYVYVVEKGSYKVKEVYRGVFAQLLTERALTEYGTIKIFENFLGKTYKKIYYDGKIKVGKVDGEVDEEATGKIELIGNYPKKIESGKKYDTLGKFPSYKIIVYENGGGEIYTGEVTRLDGDNYNIINEEIKIQNGITKDDTNIHISTKENSEYYDIYLSQAYPYTKCNYKIKIIYGRAFWSGGDFVEIDTDTFVLEIEPKSLSELPEKTEGTVILKNVYTVGAPKETTLTFTDKSNGKLDVNDSILAYERVMGEVPKILDISNVEYRKNFPEENKNFLRVSYTNNGGQGAETWEKDYEFNGKNNIDLDFLNGLKGIAHNVNGLELGDIVIKGKGESGKEKYYSIIFKTVNADGAETGWKNNEYREAAFTLKFQYITAKSDKDFKILKEDILNIVVKPLEERLAPETRGTLLITKSKGLSGHNLFLQGGKIKAEWNINDTVKWNYNPEGVVSVSGKLPTGFPSNNNGKESKYWVNRERDYRLIIRDQKGEVIETTRADTKPNETNKPQFNGETGDFRTKGKDGWNLLASEHKDDIGYIYFSYKDDSRDSITIGFRFSHLDTSDSLWQKDDFEWDRRDKGAVNKYAFEYQVKIGEGNSDADWKTIKTDILELIIQPGLNLESPEIHLKNPLVYYDYDSSSAISNVVHDKRVHISDEAPKTLRSGGNVFSKNTSLNGDNWIETKNTTAYEYNYKHKVSIVRGTDEVLKNTTDDGGTLSSTYLSGDKVGSINGTKNEVMFSYDGGNKYLNFGLSKYNFDGEEKEINDIVVSHFDNGGSYLSERKVYKVIIPAFEGIHYVGNYDIKPKQSYTKNYAYDPTKPNTAEIIMDYGTVGFRNLDTRITNQSGGDGIDIRAVKKVKLVSEDESYVIKDAELFFETEKEEPNDDNGRTSRFKGENEKATSAMLKLRIPVQETLIPKGRFKILTDDGKDVDNYPLRVGVTVNKNAEKYYTPIDDEPKGKDGKNLYLNITTNRFVETIIEFENPDLKNDNQGENWIRLNDSTYAGGVLSREIVSEDGSTSNLWGRVKGDIIDIPTDRYPHLKMVLFDEENNKTPLMENLNTLNGKKEFSFGQGKNFIISRENPADNHIRFTLDNGYDPVADAKTEIKFYIRYFDTSIEGKEDFLFDQRYIVRFKEKAEYKADTTVIFKNPAMAVDKTNTDNGMVNMSQSSSKGNDNSNTDYDKIEWYKVLNPIESYPEINLISLTRIEDNKTINDYSRFLKIEDVGGKKVLYFGIPNERTKFEELFGGYDGSRIEKSFALKFAQDNSSSYRLNVVIEKFDPKYFGKVYPISLENEDYTTYKEINAVGKGNIDLTKSNLQPDNFVYVDLGTFYRDYLRYEALPETLLKKDMEVKAEGVVEAVPKNSLYAEKISGELVLSDNGNYTNLSAGSKKIEFTADGKNMPKSYPLKLKLTPEEYKKLKPYTEYEIFFNGEQNVLTIGADTLKDNIIFDRPLNFNTTGPSLKIETTVLDFGQIKPKEAKEQLIKKEGKTETPVRVIMSGEFDSKLALQKTLVVDKDIIWLKQQSINGGAMKNGGQLRVRDLKAVKHVTETPQTREGQEIIEEYDITGILEVPKDIDESKYGEYIEYLGVTYTFY